MSTTVSVNEVRAEAIRVVPGMLAAKRRNDSGDVTLLFRDYFEYARDRGVNRAQAWPMLLHAAMHWITEALTSEKLSEISDLDEAIAMMARTAAEWAGERQGPDGA